jgi:leucyl aminopeptidase
MTAIKFNEKIKLSGSSIVFLTKEQAVSPKLINIGDSIFHGQFSQIVREKRFSGEFAETFPLLIKNGITLIVGLGPQAKLSKTSFCIAVKQALESPYLKTASAVNIFSHSKSDEAIGAIIEGVQIGTYRWRKYFQKKGNQKSLLSVMIAAASKKSYIDRIKICEGVNYTRDLVNENAEITNSIFIESEARRIIRQKKNVKIDVLGEKELRKKGLNLILAVNKGSEYPPRLIIIKYQGAKKNSDYTVIVGKGITFDTGGLNLKPTGSVETMRSDMAGAAAVLGVMKNVISLGIKANILFVVAIAENAIGAGSQKPGDVIKSYDGKTVELANMDAEGRLLLADVLSYTVKNYQPKKIIDIATLTGACAVALGHDYSGLLSNNDEFADKVLKIGQLTDDRLWPLPLYPELKNNIKSQYADIKNSGLPKGVGGTMSAAEFLRQFVGDVPWVHLDIAGTAFADGAGRLYFNYGATGVGVRLLTNFLENN